MSDDALGTMNKDYIRPMPSAWWLKKRTYFLFMVRELTCLFVGGYAIYLLVLAARRDDPQAFAAMLGSPLLITLQVIALPMLLFHSVTWLSLTRKVMVVWRGEERVDPTLVAAANFVAWIILSIIVLWFALRFG